MFTGEADGSRCFEDFSIIDRALQDMDLCTPKFEDMKLVFASMRGGIETKCTLSDRSAIGRGKAS